MKFELKEGESSMLAGLINRRPDMKPGLMVGRASRMFPSLAPVL